MYTHIYLLLTKKKNYLPLHCNNKVVTRLKYVHRFIMIHHFITNLVLQFSLTFYRFLYPCPFLLQVIGGDLQERLIPVPYSKSTTDQAVREIQYFCIVVQNPFILFLHYRVLSTPTYALFNVYFCMDVLKLCMLHSQNFLSVDIMHFCYKFNQIDR